MDPSGIKVVKSWKRPSPPTEIRSFLNIVGYYQRFVKDFLKIASPLTKLTCKNAKYGWTDKCELSFLEIKKRLCTAPILTLPQPDKKFVVYSDASHKGLGCVLM